MAGTRIRNGPHLHAARDLRIVAARPPGSHEPLIDRVVDGAGQIVELIILR